MKYGLGWYMEGGDWAAAAAAAAAATGETAAAEADGEGIGGDSSPKVIPVNCCCCW